jgi:hypothetical protein
MVGQLHTMNLSKYAVRYKSALCDLERTLRYQVVFLDSAPYNTVLVCTVPYRTVPYGTVPYRTVPYHDMYQQCVTVEVTTTR